MVPDIQLRLLDVGFPKFNITYCTSSSGRYVLIFLQVGFPTFNVTYCTSGSRRVDTANFVQFGW